MATPSKDQIREMQNYWEVDADGIWGKQSSTAAGGMDVGTAWQEYQMLTGPRNEPSPAPTPNKTPTPGAVPDTTQPPVQQGGAEVGYGLLGKNGKVGGLNYDTIPGVTGSKSSSTSVTVGGLPGANYTPAGVNLNGYNPNVGFGDALDKWLKAASDQQTGAINYATAQGIADLQRAEQDAQAQFQTQRDQVDLDEAKAKDNQALYAETRGDKGGIGAAQYDNIMATAARNRMQVNTAQTKLSTDTARQVADLRAQGEFEKADALLTLTQEYLSQLVSLEQWSLQFGLDVAQFNNSLKQWQAEYDLQVAELTGMYRGAPTLKYQQQQKSELAAVGEALLKAGIRPSPAQWQAMGYTSEDQIDMVLAGTKLTGDPIDTGVPRFSNLSEATAYLRANAFMQSEIDEILTPEKWNNLRAKYTKTGSGNAAVINYTNYVDYLNDYVHYMLEQ